MLTAACGDALGWPIEPRGQRVGGTASLKPRLAFIGWDRREGGGYTPFQRSIPAGTYSDDTQLMIAAARSLTCGEDGWWRQLTGFELPAWTLYELGGGGAIKRAAQRWSKDQTPWEAPKAADRRRYFDAGANGVAMRILPHAIFGARDPGFDRVSKRIVADGLTTHGHPRALVGGLAAGFAMWTALRWSGKVRYGELIDACLDERTTWGRLPAGGLDAEWLNAAEESLKARYEAAWMLTCDEMEGLLINSREAIGRGSVARDEEVLEELGAFGKEGGSGTRTAAAAIYLASRYVAQPDAGLLAAAFARRADSDTIACITGGILGAFSGDEEVGGLADGLTDAAYISKLASAVADNEKSLAVLPRWSWRTKSQVLEELSDLGRGEVIELPLFGPSRIVDIQRPETKSANNVQIWWLTSEVGQTLSITKVKKLEQRASSPRPAAYESSAAQLSIDAATGVGGLAGSSTWHFVFVENLTAAVEFYSGLLGIPVRRSRKQRIILDGHLVLEEAKNVERESCEPFRAPAVIGVFVDKDRLHSTQAEAVAAGYQTSEIERGRNGDRFRLRDRDGHLVEVFTSDLS